jgi:hypothetical protein
VAIVGDEDAVAGQIAHIGQIGATDFMAAPFGSKEERDRTTAAMAALTGR